MIKTILFVVLLGIGLIFTLHDLLVRINNEEKPMHEIQKKEQITVVSYLYLHDRTKQNTVLL